MRLTLNDAQIKAEKASGKRRRISDAGGLLLEIDPSGGKYWLWRHRYPPTKNGKQQDYRIGPYPKFSLKKARQIRDEQKQKMLVDLINPCAAKRDEKAKQVRITLAKAIAKANLRRAETGDKAITMNSLAVITGVAATTITRLARNDDKAASALSLDLASKLVTALDCGIEDLMEVVVEIDT